ncbi:MAG: aldehyde dehydrogenase family protein [Thermoplasmata archaeon]
MTESFGVYNPFNGELLRKINTMDITEIRSAINRAVTAQKELQSLSIAERSAMLMKCSLEIIRKKDDLAALMSREIGRPIKSSRGEIIRTSEIFKIASSEVVHIMEGRFLSLGSFVHPPGNERRIAMVIREPVGVVGSITPFNFPASSFAQKVAPSLAVGNTVVHKPARAAPLTQMELSSIILDSGFPKGSVEIVHGVSSEIGDEFISNPEIAAITFTGSEKVGLDLASRAIKNGKKVVMELGGSDPEIVLDDADLDKAADAVVVGRFDYAGQFCNATKRLIVQDSIIEKFTKILSEKMNGLKIGDPMNENTVMGPMIHSDAIKEMSSFLEETRSKGGKVLYQGKTPDDRVFFPPTIIRIDRNAPVLDHEVFGPLIPVISVKNDEEAVERANETEYGLDASVFTGSFDRAYRMAGKLKTGTVIINDTTRLRWDSLPFGGVKKSGIGRESVPDSMRELTNEKMIVYRVGD